MLIPNYDYTFRYPDVIIPYLKFKIINEKVNVLLTQEVRGNLLRQCKEVFKSRVRNKFARSVTQRHR